MHESVIRKWRIEVVQHTRKTQSSSCGLHQQPRVNRWFIQGQLPLNTLNILTVPNLIQSIIDCTSQSPQIRIVRHTEIQTCCKAKNIGKHDLSLRSAYCSGDLI